MRLKDQVTEVHKMLKSKKIDISKEQVSDVLKAYSEIANYKLSRGEPFEIYLTGSITPRLFSRYSNLKNEEFTTVKFQFKINAQVKTLAKEKIPKV